ncbi:MAG TPA: potassium-transporting ATPase subunit KdpA, partial [Puia sp.]|nr:potassium-transporting ATPase subunit KdpA [Puia sp.]
MTLNGFLQIAVFFLIVLAVTKPLGVYMVNVFQGKQMWISKILGPIERLIYQICRVDEHEEQHWTVYTAAMLVFSLAGMLLLYALERLQYHLPLNPQKLPGVAADLAF